jgi:protein subunit release factor B
VQETFSLMKKEMEILKLNFKILEMIEGKVSGFQSITLEVEENSEFLNSWKGNIQFIGKSKFRTNHQRKNWFIGVLKSKISLNLNLMRKI